MCYFTWRRCVSKRRNWSLLPHLHHAFAEAFVVRQCDRYAAGKLVTLLVAVLLYQLGELVNESRTNARHALEVGVSHTYSEAIRREDAVARDDRGFGVEFATQRRRDLHRLQARLKGLGECAIYGALKALFKVIQYAHRSPDPLRLAMSMLLGSGVNPPEGRMRA